MSQHCSNIDLHRSYPCNSDSCCRFESSILCNFLWVAWINKDFGKWLSVSCDQLKPEKLCCSIFSIAINVINAYNMMLQCLINFWPLWIQLPFQRDKAIPIWFYQANFLLSKIKQLFDQLLSNIKHLFDQNGVSWSWMDSFLVIARNW